MEIQQLHAQERPDVFRAPNLSALQEFFESQFTLGKHALIAVGGQEPIGYLLAEHIQREGNAFKHESSILYVHHVSVAASARRRGVGRALIDAATNVAHTVGASLIRLDSWQFNSRAHQFFDAQGFAPVNVIFERAVERDVERSASVRGSEN
ncbi:GNAT family N-acetyltransferase [Nocardia salmonicida]|uniref:GNAT family N-acetyltransferase n=1 Tax=Nocardia salmonicida TaxID=53431 RepID=UPI0036452597